MDPAKVNSAPHILLSARGASAARLTKWLANRKVRNLAAQALNRWGASKPNALFFERVAEVTPFCNDEILYVGDRVDNDLRPAVAPGMHAALVHRGPWATIQWRSEEAEKLPTFRVESPVCTGFWAESLRFHSTALTSNRVAT